VALAFALGGCSSGGSNGVDGGSNLAAGKFVYATNFNDDKVSEFLIDQSTGALSLAGTVAAGDGTGGAFGLAVHPSYKYLYVANGKQHTLFEFAIDASSGALTNIGKVTFAAGVQPEMVAIEPGGGFLYMTDFNGDQVFQFSVSSTGALQALSPPTIAVAGSGPIGVKIDPTAKYAYVAEQCGVDPSNPCGEVEAFKIGAGGVLTSLGAMGSLGPTNGQGSPSLLAVDSAGRNVFVADGFVGRNGEVISQFSIGATGALTFVTALPLGGARRPFDIALTPNDSFAFASTDSSVIAQFSVNPSTGAMALNGTASAPGDGLAIDRGGQVLYTAQENGKVAAFTIDSQGALHLIGSGAVDTESPPNAFSVDVFLVIAG
jgi:6-phosphogluconolactonase (cycloisomerase 2 family)